MGARREIELVARERGSALVGYAFLLTGDLASAQDLVQDAFVRTFARFGPWRDVGHIEAYVRRAILNGARDGYRRRQTLLGATPRLVAVADPPTDGVAAEHVDLERALAALSPRQRACVVLRYYDDLSVRETAEALRLSEGAVKRYLAEARGRLGDALADEPAEHVPVRLTPPGSPRRAR